jgi:hypothetical protein
MRASRASAVVALIACLSCREVTTIGAEHSDAAVRDAGSDASVRDAASDAAADAAADAMIFDGTYIEAEDGVLDAFVIEDNAGASSGRALLAPDVFSDELPGEARATYTFQLAASGDYILWGRVYAPDVDANRFWLQLDGGAWFLWRISTGTVWYWDDVHDDREYGAALTFALEAGVHTLALANAGPGARIDRFYITKDGDVPPGNDTACRPPHTIELDGTCLPSCGLLMGTACGPVDCMGREPLPAYDCDVCCQVE